jgi:hypothetical protein
VSVKKGRKNKMRVGKGLENLEKGLSIISRKSCKPAETYTHSLPLGFASQFLSVSLW